MITKIREFFSKIPLWAYALAIFAVALGARIHWLEKKDGLHVDEVLSVELSFGHKWWRWFDDVEFGKEYSGAEVKRLTLGGDVPLRKGLSHMRKENYDHAHTNFYYSLLRIANIANDDFGVSSVKLRAGTLNLLLFAGTFWLFAALLKELFGSNRTLVCAGLAAGMLSTAALSNGIFFRPYALQELFIVAFSLLCVRTFKNLRTGTPVVSPKNLFLWALLVAATLLTVYSSAIFVCLAWGALATAAWKSEERKTLPFLGTVLVAAIIFASVIYPNYLHGFFEGRGSEAAHNLLRGEILKNLQETLVATGRCLCDGLFYVPIVIVLGGAFIWHYLFAKGNVNVRMKDSLFAPKRTALILIAIVFVWTELCFYVAPWKTLRYVMAGFPLLALSVPVILREFHGKTRTILCGFTIAVYALCAFSAERTVSYKDEIAYRSEPLKRPFALIEQTCPGKSEIPAAALYAILGAERTPGAWTFYDIIPILPDDAKVIFVRDEDIASFTENSSDGTIFLLRYGNPYKIDAESGIRRIKDALSFSSYTVWEKAKRETPTLK